MVPESSTDASGVKIVFSLHSTFKYLVVSLLDTAAAFCLVQMQHLTGQTH